MSYRGGESGMTSMTFPVPFWLTTIFSGLEWSKILPCPKILESKKESGLISTFAFPRCNTRARSTGRSWAKIRPSPITISSKLLTSFPFKMMGPLPSCLTERLSMEELSKCKRPVPVVKTERRGERISETVKVLHSFKQI